MPTISVRLTDEQRAGLGRVAQPRGGNISGVLQELIDEKIDELAREPELIAALDEAVTTLTIALQHTKAGPLPVVAKVAPNGASIEGIAVVQARRHGRQVAVELAGVGELEGARVMLAVVPSGRSVKFEIRPSELSPATP